MTKIYLYGELRNKFGSEFKFKVNSAKEALFAINSNRKGFLNEIKKLGAKSIHYRIVVDDYVIANPEEVEIKKIPKEIHIVPVVWGAGIETAIAWLATYLVPVFGGYATAVATVVVYTAAAVAVAGIMTLLFPPPKPNFDQETKAGARSYLFGNKPNNTAQGQAVPVGYGRLKIGGSQISAGLSHHPMNLDIKQLMTPADKPINDYTSLEFANEAPDSTDGLVQDSFSTNQAAQIEESVSFASATIVNSYIDIVSKNAYKVTSSPVEVVVKRDGDIVSNINLDSYDEDIEYEWSLIERPGLRIEERNVRPSTVRIEKPYAFQNGLVFRSYHPVDYVLTTNFENIQSTGDGYFFKYISGDLVKFGPTQFERLPIGEWDFSTRYFSGQVVRYTTGTQTDVYFQTFVTGTGGPFLGFDGTTSNVLTNPTGSDGLVRSNYWAKITPPTEEYIYKALRDVTGLLPSTGANASNLPNWTGLFSVVDKTAFDELLSGMPSYKFEGTYEGKVEATNEQSAFGGRTNANNYAMELMGYFYVPLSEDLKKQVPDTSPNVMYEIIKVGATGQWSGIGLTGAGGIAIPPNRGVTFVKNSTQSTGDGVCYPVVKYKFKIDSDDAADLYIDGQLASKWYGKHGLVSPSTPDGIAALPSTTNELLLTAGYHHLYARFQDGAGADGISLYYQYDTNWDGGYSNFAVIPADRLKYRQISDLDFPKNQKFMSRSWQIPVSSMVSGKQYKILDLGNTTNWTSIGASSPVVGTVFTKTNNTPANSNGYVFEDLYNYAESKSSEGNRVVQFSAERAKINGRYSNGYSSASAEYNCKVTLDGVTLTTSPVRVKIKMLQTDTPLADLPSANLPIANYRT